MVKKTIFDSRRVIINVFVFSLSISCSSAFAIDVNNLNDRDYALKLERINKEANLIKQQNELLELKAQMASSEIETIKAENKALMLREKLNNGSSETVDLIGEKKPEPLKLSDEEIQAQKMEKEIALLKLKLEKESFKKKIDNFNKEEDRLKAAYKDGEKSDSESRKAKAIESSLDMYLSSSYKLDGVYYAEILYKGSKIVVKKGDELPNKWKVKDVSSIKVRISNPYIVGDKYIEAKDPDIAMREMSARQNIKLEKIKLNSDLQKNKGMSDELIGNDSNKSNFSSFIKNNIQ